MEFREPFPIMTDIQRLEQLGFSREQIAGLQRVKALHQREAFDQTESSYKRQAFVRWLYRRGLLQS